jgi:hypothetical protein
VILFEKISIIAVKNDEPKISITPIPFFRLRTLGIVFFIAGKSVRVPFPHGGSSIRLHPCRMVADPDLSGGAG